MKKYINRGFTLIELLVVIAIIGILSSIVLASLNTARSKGGDAAVKGNLSGIRSQAELQYDTLGCYANTGQTCSATVPAVVTAGACPAAGTASIFGHTTVNAAIANAKSASQGVDACSATVGGGAWAVVVQLKELNTTGWCVDSTGKSKKVTLASADQTGATAEVAAGACVE